MADSKITSKEAIMLIVTIFVSHTIVTLPENLLSNTKSATLINLIYLGIIVSLLAYVIYRLLKNFASLDIIDISEYLGGKVLKNIIGGIFIAYFIVTSSNLLREFCEGLRVAFFPMTDILSILIPFVIMLFVTNYLSFSSNVKAVSLIFPLVIASIIFLFFGNFKNFSFERMFPILGKGFTDTFITGLGNIFAFSGISCLYFIPPYLKDPSKMKQISLTSVVIGLLYFLFCTATVLLLFSFFVDVDEVLPLFSAASYIEFGVFFQRLESFFMLVWILEIGAYLMITNRFSISIFQKMTSIKYQRPLSMIFPLLVLGIALLPKNYSVIRFLETNIYAYFIIAIVFVLGISILVLANLKKKKERKV